MVDHRPAFYDKLHAFQKKKGDSTEVGRPTSHTHRVDVSSKVEVVLRTFQGNHQLSYCDLELSNNKQNNTYMRLVLSALCNGDIPVN